ncbi:ExbD/TolR family protein [Sphingomonas oryzagri]|uniref:Biopolymer transporter ExbD n=1 Tax=Sphingomonas oryzagri TaxID=3042314 RepID=A0ABT6N309_9SPHN|nr:biopolymer transporter ExbD [Sphingomonas oryzagri]MDH7639699.1 biopolymer transporter ExbD [Sphingomonas oryzagri]
MAISVRSIEPSPLMEINTTPLIDVLLVLLIMFILTIPIQTHKVPLDLPSGGTPAIEHPDKNLISTDAAGHMFWNGQAVADLRTLRQYIDLSETQAMEPELHLRPDPATRYAIVDGIIAVVKQSQVGKFAFEGNERYAGVF